MLTKKNSEVKNGKNSKETENIPVAKKQYASAATEYSAYDPKKNQSKTKVTVKYDVGFSNQLYIRGKGANLSWEKGIVLKNVKPDEWVWETDAHFSNCEFKVLINDKNFESGDNHYLIQGSTIVYTPHF